jgi:hypothetical protein
MKQLKMYLTSLNVYSPNNSPSLSSLDSTPANSTLNSPFAYVIPFFGVGEIPQANVMVSSVWGATTMRKIRVIGLLNGRTTPDSFPNLPPPPPPVPLHAERSEMMDQHVVKEKEPASSEDSDAPPLLVDIDGDCSWLPRQLHPSRSSMSSLPR